MNSVQTIRECFDQSGIVIQKLHNNNLNHYPGQTVARFAEIDANGNAFTCDNCNSQNYQQVKQEQIDNAAETIKKVNQHTKDLSRDMEKFQIDLQTQLKNMFSGSFPF